MSTVNRMLKHALDACNKAIEVGERFGADISVVAVDRGGHILVAMRMDRTAYNSMEPARRKAVTAASLQFPTATILEMVGDDPVAMNALSVTPDMLAVPGGVPLRLDGACYGGLGIAGGHYSEDQLIVEKVMESLAGSEEESRD